MCYPPPPSINKIWDYAEGSRNCANPSPYEEFRAGPSSPRHRQGATVPQAQRRFPRHLNVDARQAHERRRDTVPLQITGRKEENPLPKKEQEGLLARKTIPPLVCFPPRSSPGRVWVGNLDSLTRLPVSLRLCGGRGSSCDQSRSKFRFQLSSLVGGLLGGGGW